MVKNENQLSIIKKIVKETISKLQKEKQKFKVDASKRFREVKNKKS